MEKKSTVFGLSSSGLGFTKEAKYLLLDFTNIYFSMEKLQNYFHGLEDLNVTNNTK